MTWLLFATPALGWDSIGATWRGEDTPIPYWISSDLGQLDDARAEAAIRAGVETWAAPDCGVPFEYQGRTDAPYGGEPDGLNVVYVIADAWPGEAALLTDQRITTEGTRILEGDLALNAQFYAWATENANGVTVYDVQAGVTHEVGHWLGLWHSTDPEATLNPALTGHPDGRDLAPDDLEGLCALYGSGAADVGETCVETSDCLGGLVCVVDGPDRYCTTECSGDGDCPADWTCEALGADSVCAKPYGGGCGCGAGGSRPGWSARLLAALSRR